MEFVIWGARARGIMMLDLLGEDKVIAFVDQDVELQNTAIRGIDVISPESYFLDYRDYPIFVTPKGYEDEIIQQLNDAGVYWAFSYTDEFASIESLFLQVSLEAMMQSYQHREEFCIYGYNALSLLVYEYLYNKGYSCNFIQIDSMNESVQMFLKEILKINLETKEECIKNKKRILFTTNITENEKKLFAGNKTENYYNLNIETARFFNPKIEKFRDKHNGRRCFIVATGPSLAINDLNTLGHNKEICISVNGIFPAFANTSWRPDYYIIADFQVMKKWKKEIQSFESGPKFIADTACKYPEEVGIKWHGVRAEKDCDLPKFSDDFAMQSFLYGTIVYNAIQLAVYMGFSEIFLIGVDCNYQKGSRNNHFFQEKERDQISHGEESMQKAFVAAKNYADVHGIKIYNATRGGMLEVFERVNFDNLF